MTTPNSEPLQHPSPLSRLFDLALAIERQNVDRIFAEKGTIRYVFDENVFELFVFPYVNRRYCDVFLEERFVSPELARAAISTSAQSALITSEILFGGALSGQSKGEILLTRGHREELLDRMNEEVVTYRSADREVLRQNAIASLEIKRKFHEARQTAAQVRRTDPSLHASADRVLQDDLLELRSAGVAEDAIALFRETRTAALRLSRDPHEAQEQLARVLSAEMQNRITGVASIWRPAPEILGRLADRANFWFAQIRREIKNQRLQKERLPRPPQATRNDAESLALLEWIASQLPSNERIVLVTGDSTLMNAYRRNFNSPSFPDKDVTPHFLLRSPVQYSTIFNPAAAMGEFLKTDGLFFKVREALDICLVTFQVAALADGAAKKGLKGRLLSELQHLSLEPLLPPNWTGPATYQPNQIDQFWSDQTREFDLELVDRVRTIAEDWRKAERLTLGLASEHVAKRTTQEHASVFDEMRTKAAPEQKQLILDYVERIVARVAVTALEVWKPIARKFFEKSIPERPESESRVPLAIKLNVVENGHSADLVHFLCSRESRIGVQGPALGTKAEFLENAFELFMAACILALLKREWRLANYFSDMATSSFEYLRGQQSTTELRAAEAYYATALARRIQLGEVDVLAGPTEFDAATRWYEAALNSLLLVRRYGTLRNQPSSAKNLGDFREFRHSSERAALELFMCFQCWRSQVQGWQSLTDQHLEQARNELDACLRVASVAPHGYFDVGSGDDAVALVTKQFLINISAWFVVGHLCSFKLDLNGDNPLIRKFNECVDALVSSMDRRVGLFIAELYAFDILQKKRADEMRSKLSTLEFSGANALAIDHSLFNAIKAEFASPSG